MNPVDTFPMSRNGSRPTSAVGRPHQQQEMPRSNLGNEVSQRSAAGHEMTTYVQPALTTSQIVHSFKEDILRASVQSHSRAPSQSRGGSLAPVPPPKSATPQRTQQHQQQPRSVSSRLYRLWGKQLPASELKPRDLETDEDILYRALGISLGPLIGAKRGVRIEDARGDGEGIRGVKVVKGYGIVESGDIRKRKRRSIDEDGDDADINIKRRRIEEAEKDAKTALSWLARRKKNGIKPRKRSSFAQMEVDSEQSN